MTSRCTPIPCYLSGQPKWPVRGTDTSKPTPSCKASNVQTDADVLQKNPLQPESGSIAIRDTPPTEGYTLIAQAFLQVRRAAVLKKSFED